MATGRPLVISLARYATPIRQYSVSPQSFAAWRARPSAQFMGWFSAVQRRGPILPPRCRAVEKEAQERYEKQSRQLADALAARDKALSDARDVRVTSVRVRDAADTRAKSDLQIARDTGDRTQERLARCESLLGEGAELAGEGAELLTRVAADKDTMAKAIQ